MNIRHFVVPLLCAAAAATFAHSVAPDALVMQISSDVLKAVIADRFIKRRDVRSVTALVDTKVMPYVDAERMTASAVGRDWRQATPSSDALEDQFTLLLLRTYAGALTQVSAQTIELKPMRGSATDLEVVVRTEIRGLHVWMRLEPDCRDEIAAGVKTAWPYAYATAKQLRHDRDWPPWVDSRRPRS